LGQLLDGFDAIVSFNGRSFDLPLLETRFIMTRQTPRLVNAPHLDLLPVSRSIWKYRLPSCALSALEPNILGVRRTESDVPGWLIPSLYMQYTRTGDAREIARVFYHNAQDILSLVTLAACQCDLLTLPLSAESGLPGEDLYGLGRLHLALDQPDRAEVAFAQAAQLSKSRNVREMSMRDLAYLLKRQDRRDEALPWWQSLVETVGAVYACEELAKHYEWQDGDLSQAMAWTQRGIDLVQKWSPGPKRSSVLEELNHRQDRLARKRNGPTGAQESSASSGSQ
jgi:tetratricopeptide (TPR) repeat protein